MFIREEELNSYRRKICVWFRIYLTPKRYHSKIETQITKKLSPLRIFFVFFHYSFKHSPKRYTHVL